MKQLNLVVKIDDLNLGTEKNEKTPSETCMMVIKNVVLNWASSGNRRGLNEEDRRKYYKISDAFDAAVESKATEVQLDDDWLGLIRKAFRECELMPDKLLRRVEDNVMAIKDR